MAGVDSQIGNSSRSQRTDRGLSKMPTVQRYQRYRKVDRRAPPKESLPTAVPGEDYENSSMTNNQQALVGVPAGHS